jgi:hypothetical protein
MKRGAAARFGVVFAVALGLYWLGKRDGELAGAREARVAAYKERDSKWQDSLYRIETAKLVLSERLADAERIAQRHAARAATSATVARTLADSVTFLSDSLVRVAGGDTIGQLIEVHPLIGIRWQAERDGWAAALTDEQTSHARTRDLLALERESHALTNASLTIADVRLTDLRRVSVDLERIAYVRGARTGRLQGAGAVLLPAGLIIYALLK